MKRTILYLPFIVILSLFATACGATPTPETTIQTAVSEAPTATPTSEPPTSTPKPPTPTAASGPKLASSFEDIAGTWHSTTTSAEVQPNEDGTWRHRTAEGTLPDAEFRFEGTRLFLTATPGSNCTLIGAEIGIYEVELLENGNLKFAAIEDECATRVSYLEGALIEAEWEPVP